MMTDSNELGDLERKHTSVNSSESMEHCHTVVENSQKSMWFSNLELITLSMEKNSLPLSSNNDILQSKWFSLTSGKKDFLHWVAISQPPWPSLDICFLIAIKTKTKKSQPLVLAEIRSVVCMLNINSRSVNTHISAITHICKPFPQWKLGVGRVEGSSDTVKQQYKSLREHQCHRHVSGQTYSLMTVLWKTTAFWMNPRWQNNRLNMK